MGYFVSMRIASETLETPYIEHILDIFSDVRSRVIVASRQLAAALAGHRTAGREAGESLVGGLDVVREVLSVRSVWSRWIAERCIRLWSACWCIGWGLQS